MMRDNLWEVPVTTSLTNNNMAIMASKNLGVGSQMVASINSVTLKKPPVVSGILSRNTKELNFGRKDALL